MKCSRPKCRGDLRVTHTHAAGDAAQTRDYVCSQCGCRYSSVTFLVERPSQKRKKKGQAGAALAKLVEEGRLALEKKKAP